MRNIICVILILLAGAGFAAHKGGKKMNALAITSPAFKDQAPIPKKYSCEGEEINPPLLFHNVPKGAKSLALIVDDPDAPSGTFVHWIVFNITPETWEIMENSSPEGSVPGNNSIDKTGYTAPCPPPGKVHHYRFKLYALDSVLGLEEGSTKQEVEKEMSGHIISQAVLTGLYKR